MSAVKPRTHRKSSSAANTSKRAGKKGRAASNKETPRSSLQREIYGVLVASVGVLLLLSLVSHSADGSKGNWIGQTGHIVAEGVFFLFGLGAFGVVFGIGAISMWLLFGRRQKTRTGSLIGGLLVALSVVTSLAVIAPNGQAWGASLGGWIGAACADWIVGVLGSAGAILVLFAFLLIGFILLTRTSLVAAGTQLASGVRQTSDKLGIMDTITGSVARLGQGIGGMFQRRAKGSAPPFVDDEIDYDVDYDAAHTDVELLVDDDVADEITGEQRAPQMAVAEPAEQNENPPVVETPSVAQTPNTAVPPQAQFQDEHQDARAAAPVIKKREEQRAPNDEQVHHEDGRQGVIARARRAIQAFRDEAPQQDHAAPQARAYTAPPVVSDEPAAIVPPMPPVEPPILNVPPMADALNAPAAPPTMQEPEPWEEREYTDYAVSNPMILTTRQNPVVKNAPYREEDFESASTVGVRVDAQRHENAPSLSQDDLPTGQYPVVDVHALDQNAAPLASDDVRFDRYDDDDDDYDDDYDDDAFDDDDDLYDQETRPVHVGNLNATRREDEESTGPQIMESSAQKERMTSDTMERALRAMSARREETSWQFPPLDMLSYEESTSEIDEQGLRSLATLLVESLADYKVKGKVTGICPGPVVTRFEFEPEPGTKLSKISSLSTELAMRLRAENVRIIAPIPGKGCVGVEIPNDIRETVYLKEILADRQFTEAKSKISMALGKDIEGFPVVANLAKMPHLLVAGTTGSGKSVSINTMIMSILYNATPDEVKMILIDPKQLEFALYEDIPHLLLPVVTDPNQAATALQWAVDEMERRYRLMKELKVRNLEGYNRKLRKLEREVLDDQEGRQSASRFALQAMAEEDRDGRPRHRHMPYLVVVVDEFADLMMAAGKDVETSVARIAQKARAAGIHCILATQRPSVDVLTGTIKSNFPTRISFRLMTGTDSRTVIDTQGAENLLGMGDMLYRPPGSSDLVRVHGAFVDEKEIERVVEFVKDQRDAEYDETILSADVEEACSDEELDPKYYDAVEVVLDAGYASISMVQRKLSVGYNRAANIVEEMERRGVVGPSGGGASRREVLVSSP